MVRKKEDKKQLDHEKTLLGKIASVKKQIEELEEPDYAKLLKLEKKNKNRKGLVDYLEKKLGRKKKLEKEEVIEPEKPIPEPPKALKEVETVIRGWKPKTKLGKKVIQGEIVNIEEILETGKKIKEPQIVDFLLPTLENELVLIGGRPGKGGGIQRTPIRITAKMHRSGRRYSFSTFAIVGNINGIIGIGKGKGNEGRSAVAKAIEKAKLNLIKVPRGCGSWECECNDPHSIPFKVKGKSGSVRVTLFPAPKGIGLAVDNETKKLLRLAGIKDVWIKTQGNTSTRFNLIKAVFDALRNLHFYKTGG